LALRSTNWAGVIFPLRSAPRPYCTPTLSVGAPAKPRPIAFSWAVQDDARRGPNKLMAASWMVHRTPPGFLAGS
jgi:hypothetical protein